MQYAIRAGGPSTALSPAMSGQRPLLLVFLVLAANAGTITFALCAKRKLFPDPQRLMTKLGEAQVII